MLLFVGRTQGHHGLHPQVVRRCVVRSWCACRAQSSAPSLYPFQQAITTSVTPKASPPRRQHGEDGRWRWGHQAMRRRTLMSMSTLAGASRKVVPFKLADIGEGIHEVELLQWFVKEGDQVKQFDRICEVQSDKATVEISSRYDGVISVVHHPVGSHVQVGAPLVDIEVPQVHTPEAVPPTLHNDPSLPPPVLLAKPDLPHPQATSASSPPPSPLRSKDDITLTTPAVRRLAKEYEVDLAYVSGTGPKGRVLKSDMLEYLKKHRGVVLLRNAEAPSPPPPRAPAELMVPPPASPSSLNGSHTASALQALHAPPPPAPSPPRPQKLPVAAPTSAVIPPCPDMKAKQRVPIQGFMKIMVKTMTASLKIPHFAYKDEVIMDKLIQVRDQLRPAAEAQGVKLTYLPIMIKAASLALSQYPVLNSSLSPDETELIYHGDHNIGVAMDTSKGLLVPVIKQCQHKSIMDITKDLNSYQALAKTASFNESHLVGGTFTLSNIGNIGGTYTNPVIVPPQVAIGAVGRIQRVPRFEGEDSMVVKAVRVVQVSWSADHRVVDGATMARFSNAWKAFLEEPALMLTLTK